MVCVDGTTVVVDSLKIAATWAALDKVVSRVDDLLVGAVTRLLTLSVGAGNSKYFILYSNLVEQY